jgi:hypothetical protein
MDAAFLFEQHERRKMGSVWKIVAAVIVAGMLGLVGSGCEKHNSITGEETITGSGRVVSESRSTGAFTGARVTNYANVIITQGSGAALRIEADDNIIERVSTVVADGVLEVGLPPGSYKNITLNVFATMEQVRLLESQGAADFRLTAPLQTDTIVCRIIGTGTVTLSGTATVEIIEITGAGDIHNFDLLSDRCSAVISGAGNINVCAKRELSAMISGTGNVVYDGNPPTVHSIITGVGAVRPRY